MTHSHRFHSRSVDSPKAVTTIKAAPASDLKLKVQRSTAIDRTLRPLGILRRLITLFTTIFVNDMPLISISIMNGLFGFIVQFLEGIKAGKEALTAYQNPKMRQRKTRIASNVLTFMLAGSGTGISLTFFAAALGAAVGAATVTIAPLLISGFFFGIYGLALWKNAYILAKTKKDEAQAARQYAECSLLKYNAQQKRNDVAHEQLSAQLQQKNITWAQKKEDLFQAERAVALNSIDTFASSLTLVAIILGAAAFIGASVASFGALPLALLITGLVLGIANQLFKHYDEKNNFSYTRNLRTWFANRTSGFRKKPRNPLQQPQPLALSIAHQKSPGAKVSSNNTPQPSPRTSLSTNCSGFMKQPQRRYSSHSSTTVKKLKRL